MARVQEWFRGYEEKGEKEKIKFVGEYEINGLERKKLGGNFCFATFLFPDSLAEEKNIEKNFPDQNGGNRAFDYFGKKLYHCSAHSFNFSKQFDTHA